MARFLSASRHYGSSMRLRKVNVSWMIIGAVVALSSRVSPVDAASVSSGACSSTVGDATNVTMSVDTDGSCVLQFRNVGTTTWTVPAGAATAEILVVGGGGSGAWSDVVAQGGGGGGGVAHASSLPVSGTYTVTVGSGGTGTNSPMSWTNGAASSFSNGSMSITADGGGAGAGWGGAVGFSGGSGGGGHWYRSGSDKGIATKGSFSGVTGVQLYGNDGGNSNLARSAGGGGGGASSAGSNGRADQIGGNGGEGFSSAISGSTVVYGSGGGAIGVQGAGTGGTNAGDGQLNAQGGDGAPNTGAGGGAAAYAYRSGHGGSGIVIVRFTVPSAPVNVSAPVVSGTLRNGETLTGSPGTWTGQPAPTFTYRWKRATSSGGTYSDIAGATSSAYVLTDSDVDRYLRLEVTATNGSGSSTALSTATATVVDIVRPVTTTTPTTAPPALEIVVNAPVSTTPVAASTTGSAAQRTAPSTGSATGAKTSSATSTTVPSSTTTVPAPGTTALAAPKVPAVAAGQAAVRIDGAEESSTLQRVDNQVVVTAGRISATVSAVRTDGSVAALDREGTVRLVKGDRIRVKVAGFRPGTDVEAWLFSAPTRLGTATVSADGSVTATFTVPADTPVGAHRIAIVAMTRDGRPATLTVGIQYGDFAAGGVPGWVIAVPILLAVLLAVFIPTTLRRRRRAVTPA